MNKVEWKDIIGYEGLYRISSLGEVLSIKRNIIKKPRVDKNGYFLIDLSKNNIATTFRLNRLVAKHFLQLPTDYQNLAVDHINGNKQDNRAINLQWLTTQENNDKRDMSSVQKKICQIDKNTGKILQQFESVREAARVVGTPHTNILRVLDKTNLSAGGYRWRSMDNV